MKREILGDSEEEESGSDEDDDEEEGGGGGGAGGVITDMTETDLVNLRRTIYLTIMSSAAGLHTMWALLPELVVIVAPIKVMDCLRWLNVRTRWIAN